MNKKGIEAKFLVGFIISLVGFILVLFIFYQISWSGVIDRQVCKDSMIARASVPEGIFDNWLKAREAFPLKCKLRYMCISNNFLLNGNCDFFSEFDTLRVSKEVSKSEQEIKANIAREMADCWDMFGRGQLNVFSRDIEKLKMDTNCIICSSIKFDENIKEENPRVTGFLDYLMSYNVQNTEVRYFDYFRNVETKEKLLVDQERFDLDTSKDYHIVLVQAKKSMFGTILGASTLGTTGAVIGSAVPGVGTLVGGGIGLIAGTTAGYIIGDEIQPFENAKGYVETFSSETYSGIFLVRDEDLKNLECKSFEHIP